MIWSYGYREPAHVSSGFNWVLFGLTDDESWIGYFKPDTNKAT